MMVPINNSDTAWLIVSDYNQDNGLPYEDLREDVLSPDVNNWSIYYMYETSGTVSVGGERRDSRFVGCDIENPNLIPMGELWVGGAVGGVGNMVGFDSIGFESSGSINTQGQHVGGHR